LFRRRAWSTSAAALLVALLVALPGCDHDWDDLRYEDTPSGLCQRLCAGYDFCVEAKPIACEDVCEANLVGCSGLEQEEIGACADDVDPAVCSIETKQEWSECVAPIACFSYP
jgi:hypothetical protein